MNTNKQKIKVVTKKVAFLMSHQEILPDLKEIISDLYPYDIPPDPMYKEHPAYLMGAHDALQTLIKLLEEKGVISGNNDI